MTARDFARAHWPAIAILITAFAIGLATIEMLRSMPLATGPEGGTYYEVGERYRTVLARENVEVRLVPTAGSVESVAMLLDPHSEVSVGLVQGGTIGAQGQSELQSLGTLFYEPYWWFRRRDIQGVGVPSLRGRKISIGPEGSGTRALSLQLLKKWNCRRPGQRIVASAAKSGTRKAAGGGNRRCVHTGFLGLPGGAAASIRRAHIGCGIPAR
jgi:TRAP-type uncharacterized transport system substrate-binding protein